MEKSGEIMSKDFVYTKLVEVGALHKLLVASGFDVKGVSYDSGKNRCTVHLADTETKDPTAIVDSYIYVPLVPIDWNAEYAKAKSEKEQIEVIARFLGLQ